MILGVPAEFGPVISISTHEGERTNRRLRFCCGEMTLKTRVESGHSKVSLGVQGLGSR